MQFAMVNYIERNGIVFRVPEKLCSRRYGPAALLIAGAGLMAGGQLYQGEAARQEAKSAANMSKYNAALADQEAKQVEAKTALEQRRQVEASDRQMGTLAANLGASGAITTEGAPLLIQAKQAAEFELDNMLMGYEGATQAARLRSQANLDRMQSKIYTRKGKAAQTASYMQAGGTLLQGFGAAKSAGAFGNGRGVPTGTGGANPTGAGGAGFSVNPITGMGF